MRSHKPIIAVVYIAAVRGGNVEYTYIQFKSSSVVTVVAEGIARLKGSAYTQVYIFIRCHKGRELFLSLFQVQGI